MLVILPLNILTGIVCLITFRQPVWMIMMVVTLVTIIGLKKRALWGWYLNFGLLILATLNYPLYLHGKRCSEYELERRLVESGLYTYARGRDISPPTITLENYLLPLAVATVCFLLPNAIYFGKRKAMFKHIGTMNKDEIQSSASVYLDSEDLDYEDDSEDD